MKKYIVDEDKLLYLHNFVISSQSKHLTPKELNEVRVKPEDLSKYYSEYKEQPEKIAESIIPKTMEQQGIFIAKNDDLVRNRLLAWELAIKELSQAVDLGYGDSFEIIKRKAEEILKWAYGK